MRRFPATLAFTVAAVTPSLGAQAAYVPATEMPNGREIVAVYLGAQSCGPCLLPAVKDAVRAMKGLLAAQAKAQGAAFSAIGVANDWSIADATAFIGSVGPFDQLVLGGNWTNLALERFVWRDSTGTPAMPQVLVFERTVTPGDAGIAFSEMRLRHRSVGYDSIPAWVRGGALIAGASGRPLR